MKQATDFFRVWGGISGCQSLFQLMLTEGYTARALPLPTIAQVTAEYAARRFGLPGKGSIAIGMDADLALVDLGASARSRQRTCSTVIRHSPYVGMLLRGRIVRTLVRGTTVYRDGKIVSEPVGRLVTPDSRGHHESLGLNA